MRSVSIKRFDGGEDIVNAYEYNELDIYNIPDALLNVFRHKSPKEYFYTFATFDIETTTIIPEGEDSPFGFMYHWQMCIGGACVYGRRWEEWIDLMGRIANWLGTNRERRLVIYVHNLGYEFQFIKDFIEEYFSGGEVFAAKSRKPIRVTCGNGIEFRCSYFLTNMNLQKACENEMGVIHPKAAGDLDYKKKIRTAGTPLDDTEFAYCIADVLSLYEMIKCRLKNEKDNLDSIPMTSTGYVRRDCRRACRADRRYRDNVFKKNIMTPEIYKLLKEAGRGGNTHANRYLSGRIWQDVDSFDVASSYPAQMMLKKFPMKAFYYYGEIENNEEFTNLLAEYACLFRIIIENLIVKKSVTMPYIPCSKIISKTGKCLLDNGRVLSCDGAIVLTITDIDYKIISDQYEWESISVSDFHIAPYGYLPECLRGQVMEYFKLKTELKDKIAHEENREICENYEYLYGKSKNRLNGIFGMTYTDPVREKIVCERGEWKPPTVPDIAEALAAFYRGRNSFLVYAWGIWITAHARAHLQALLDATGDGTIYCDTDSSKAMNVDKAKVEALNREIMRQADELGAYCDYNGKRYYLGVYELETKTPYKRFKTLGAKKYAYEDESGLHVTISGVSKKLGAKELQKIENFVPGFIFREAGGSTLYYNDDSIKYININGCTMLTASNIGMIDSTYEIGITNEYAELIGYNYLEV